MKKKCQKCNKKKDLKDFHKCKNGSFGVNGYCKPCKYQYSREHIERYRVASRKYIKNLSKNKLFALRERCRILSLEYAKTDRGIASRKRYKSKNIEKVKAHKLFNAYTRYHKIKKGKCKFCIKGGKKTDAHHPDYSKPFSIVWLCRIHHSAIHLGKLKLKKEDIIDYK